MAVVGSKARIRKSRGRGREKERKARKEERGGGLRERLQDRWKMMGRKGYDKRGCR